MSMESHYTIDLKRLKIGTHEFEVTLDDGFFKELEKTEVLGGKVEAKIALNLREEDYWLTIAVHGTVFVTCDRCLDPMSLEIDASETSSPNDEMSANESLNDEPKASNDVLDLTWLAYEIVSINIPVVHCHQAGECNKQMELLLQDHLCDEPEPEEIE
jgi:uncharacterized metal-binding protein YceD (DUF177 family)